MRKRVLLAIGGTLASVVMGASAVNGSFAERGGNHGCGVAAGTFFSDDFFEPGDTIVGGFLADFGKFPTQQDLLVAQNTSSYGGTPSPLNCGAEPGAWKLFQARLGPGDDSVRLDAKGLESELGPLPQSIDTLLAGGEGRDTIRGHTGRDVVTAGAGADVVKVDDGKRDIVRCGGGDDKADVDRKDKVSGCETES